MSLNTWLWTFSKMQNLRLLKKLHWTVQASLNFVSDLILKQVSQQPRLVPSGTSGTLCPQPTRLQQTVPNLHVGLDQDLRRLRFLDQLLGIRG